MNSRTVLSGGTSRKTSTSRSSGLNSISRLLWCLAMASAVSFARFSGLAKIAWRGFVDSASPDERRLCAALLRQRRVDPVAGKAFQLEVLLRVPDQHYFGHALDARQECLVKHAGRTSSRLQLGAFIVLSHSAS